MQDIVPTTWVDGATAISDLTMNTEIRNAYLMIMNPPMCQVHSVGSYSIPNGAGWTVLAWDTVNFDTEDPATPMWSAGNSSRIYIRTPGWYELCASVELFSPPGSLTWTTNFLVNGTTHYAGSTCITNGASLGPLDCSPSNLVALNAGDYVELAMNHSYGSAITIDQRGYQPLFTVARRRGL